MNQYLSPAHIVWMEQLSKMRKNHRTSTPIPVQVFNELKSLNCVQGDPTASSLTAHGAGVLYEVLKGG